MATGEKPPDPPPGFYLPFPQISHPSSSSAPFHGNQVSPCSPIRIPNRRRHSAPSSPTARFTQAITFPPLLPSPNLTSSPVEEAIQVNPTANQTRPWSDIIKNKPASAGKIELVFQEPIFVDGVLQIEDDLLAEGEKNWEKVVVGFFLDKKLYFKKVEEEVKRNWKLKGKMDMAREGELFYFRFFCEEDRRDVLERGSMLMKGKIFIITTWSKEMEQGKSHISKIPIWVRMSNIPSRLRNPKGIAKIASAIGKPCFLDRKTEENEFAAFGRVCIEIEATKELPESFAVRNGPGKSVVVNFEYDWKPFLCVDCKTFGHSTIRCPKKPKPVWRPVRKENPIPAAPPGTTQGNKVASNRSVSDIIESITSPRFSTIPSNVARTSTDVDVIIEGLDIEEGEFVNDSVQVDSIVDSIIINDASPSDIGELVEGLNPFQVIENDCSPSLEGNEEYMEATEDQIQLNDEVALVMGRLAARRDDSAQGKRKPQWMAQDATPRYTREDNEPLIKLLPKGVKVGKKKGRPFLNGS